MKVNDIKRGLVIPKRVDYIVIIGLKVVLKGSTKDVVSFILLAADRVELKNDILYIKLRFNLHAKSLM